MEFLIKENIYFRSIIVSLNKEKIKMVLEKILKMFLINTITTQDDFNNIYETLLKNNDVEIKISENIILKISVYEAIRAVKGQRANFIFIDEDRFKEERDNGYYNYDLGIIEDMIKPTCGIYGFYENLRNNEGYFLI